MVNVLLMSRNTIMLLSLMIALIVFLVLLTVLGIVFIVALRKRAPVIKVVMAPPAAQPAPAPQGEQMVMDGVEPPAEEPEAEPEEEDDEPEAEPEEESSSYVTEGKDRVHYDRSFTAKIIQLKDDSKEWYTQVKNELLSYQKVKDRMSWKKETFRLGREAIARFVVRGKTLCLLLAVEPAGFTGTKFTVEDVSAVASTADTPCLYRIKSARRAKYAKELINAVMKELGIKKDPNFEPQDYYVPYEGTMGLMERGLVKRVVTNSTRTFEIREVSDAQAEAAASQDDNGTESK